MAELPIRFVKRSEINDFRWNRMVSASQVPMIYANTWYLDAICDKWEAALVGDYHSGFPVPLAKKMGVEYAFQPHFCQQLGLFGEGAADAKLLWKVLKRFQEQYNYVEMQLNHLNRIDDVLIEVHGSFKKETRRNLVIDLSRLHSPDAYSTSTRRNIKKAIKEKLRFEENVLSFEEFIPLFQKTSWQKLKGVNERHFNWFKAMAHAAFAQNQAQIVSVHDLNGNTCAAILLLIGSTRIITLAPFTTAIGKSNGAMHFLIDRLITKHQGAFEKLDFEGSTLPGIARFYESFGATDEQYCKISINNLPWSLRWLKQ